MAREIHLVNSLKYPLDTIGAYLCDLNKNNFLLAKHLRKFFKQDQQDHYDDAYFAKKVKRIIDKDTRQYKDKTISPNLIFSNLYGNGVAQVLADIRRKGNVTDNDNERAEYELALFRPNAIFDNFDETADDKPTEIGVIGAKELFKRYQKNADIVEIQTAPRNAYELLASVNYIRNYYVFHHLLAKTNERLFGDDLNENTVNITTLLTMDTPFCNLFLKTMLETEKDWRQRLL